MLETELKPEMAENNPFITTFDTPAGESRDKEPMWLLPFRKSGLARFAELGFPTVKDEDWRFTRVSGVAELPFHPAPAAETTEQEEAMVRDQAFRDVDAIRLVFLDGHFEKSLSDVSRLPENVVICTLQEAVQSDGFPIQNLLGLSDIADENAFACLNSAYFSDGAFVRLPAHFELARPIHLIHINRGVVRGRAVQTRNLILAESGSKATVLETFYGVGREATITNTATKLLVRDGAQMEYCKVQDESPSTYHFANLFSEVGRNAKLHLHSIALGACLSRNDIRTKLNGEGLECVLNGLYIMQGRQLADHHMIVDHARPRCDSHEYFNGILNDQSRGVFHGRILVRQEAQKTDAKQTNKHLLLSDEATANTKPQLEIYADDVKCTHGATVGQMNEEAIFYLRSRGIGMGQARRMLMHSFAGEIVNRIQLPSLREAIDQIIWDRLEDMLTTTLSSGEVSP